MHKVPSRSVSAIVVTLDPHAETLAALLRAVAPQVSSIVIVDNGTTESTISSLAQANASGKHTLIENRRNLGLARAQNQGIAYALDSASDYVLLLDHDSVPANDMVGRLVAALESQEASGEKLAAAGPVFVDTRSGSESKFVRLGISGRVQVPCRDAGPERLQVDLLISSGMLIRASALRDIGMMDESLFIDHVDTEWCLRARARSYGLLGVCNAKMTHRLGDKPAPSILGRRFFVRSPVRHYFFLRNSLLLYRRPYVPSAWKISDALRLLPLTAAAVLFCAPRGRQLKAIVHGFVDGIRGRGGPIPRELEDQLSA